MNQTDRGLYKTLYYLSKRKRNKLSKSKLNKLFSEGMLKTLSNHHYWGQSGEIYVLTTKGLEELRKLESIKKNELTILISIIAIIISIISLIFSLFR